MQPIPGHAQLRKNEGGGDHDTAAGRAGQHWVAKRGDVRPFALNRFGVPDRRSQVGRKATGWARHLLMILLTRCHLSAYDGCW